MSVIDEQEPIEEYHNAEWRESRCSGYVIREGWFIGCCLEMRHKGDCWTEATERREAFYFKPETIIKVDNEAEQATSIDRRTRVLPETMDSEQVNIEVAAETSLPAPQEMQRLKNKIVGQLEFENE